jgi:predicted nucleotide-binding protein (sugar kinase/HSP70/actin superfamily)
MENKFSKKIKVGFPHLGNYWVGFKEIASMLDGEIIMPPPITKKTIDIGAKKSPDTACVPYKYTLGNFLECLEKGANVLIQAGGTSCRYAYYGEVQEAALKKMGYDFIMIRFSARKLSVLKTLLKFKKMNPKLSYYRMIKGFWLAYKKFKAVEKIEDLIRKNIGFETKKGSFEKEFDQFLKEIDKVHEFNLIKQVNEKYLERCLKIETKKPANPLRVGMIGEFYVTIESFSNFFIEKELGKRGVEVHRFVGITHELQNLVFGKQRTNKYLKIAKPYLRHHIGAHGTETVGIAIELIEKGFDGLIHIKPFGCVPEVSSMSMLHKISKDLKAPILYFSFDAQTSETGVKTRIEAFYDMLKMKKNKNYGNKTGNN